MKQQTGKAMYKEFVYKMQIWVLTADAENCLLKGLVYKKCLAITCIPGLHRKQAWLRQAKVFDLLRVSWLQMVANISTSTVYHSFSLLPGSFQEELQILQQEYDDKNWLIKVMNSYYFSLVTSKTPVPFHNAFPF